MKRLIRPLNKEEQRVTRPTSSLADGLFIVDSVTTEGKFPQFGEMKTEMTVTLEATWRLSDSVSPPPELVSDKLAVRPVSIVTFLWNNG